MKCVFVLLSLRMGMIILQIVVISLLTLLLGLIAYGDWRNMKRREAEEAEARSRTQARQETAVEAVDPD